ncbi:MAG TPA: hypothetical protein PKN11_00295, partial [Anaerolineaceae bacterium]|nr:hypothetical protein [Anaerolineaceae bacterium]
MRIIFPQLCPNSADNLINCGIFHPSTIFRPQLIRDIFACNKFISLLAKEFQKEVLLVSNTNFPSPTGNVPSLSINDELIQFKNPGV